jgi:hypothetical protein
MSQVKRPESWERLKNNIKQNNDIVLGILSWEKYTEQQLKHITESCQSLQQSLCQLDHTANLMLKMIRETNELAKASPEEWFISQGEFERQEARD